MLRRNFVAALAAAGTSLAARPVAFARTKSGAPIDTFGGTDVASETPRTGYAPVNGLKLYYEIHGSGEPLVLLHGAYGSAAMWAAFVPTLAKTRQVIVPELQGHGRTADVDRPIRYESMADDAAALLDQLAIARADVVGYSMGGGVALQLAMRHPNLVRKLVVASASSSSAAMYPEVLAMIETITPDMFVGSPFHAEYERVAPNPAAFPTLVEKLKDLDAQEFAWPDEEIRAIAAPTMVVMGDSDVVRPEHAVELFKLRGGGVPGDLAGLPNAQLAVLPATTHIGVMERADLLLAMIPPFLDAPLPEAA